MTKTAPTLHPVKIPPTIYSMPICPLCDDDCSACGTTLICSPCGVIWPDGPDAPGCRVGELDVPACAAEHQPWKGHATLCDHRYRCVLDAGHEYLHRGLRCDRTDDSEEVYVWPNVESRGSSG